MPYLLDTNVVTQLLKRSPRVVERYRRALEVGAQIYFSAVVYYEIKRGLLHLGAAKGSVSGSVSGFIIMILLSLLPDNPYLRRVELDAWRPIRRTGPLGLLTMRTATCLASPTRGATRPHMRTSTWTGW